MNFAKKLLIYSFIDNPYLCCYNCHRKPERSFFLDNRQFNVCARCTGIVAGVGLGLLLIGWNFQLLLFVFSKLFLVATFLNLIDGGTQLLGWRQSNNLLRVVLGFIFGFTLLFFLKAIWLL